MAASRPRPAARGPRHVSRVTDEDWLRTYAPVTALPGLPRFQGEVGDSGGRRGCSWSVLAALDGPADDEHNPDTARELVVYMQRPDGQPGRMGASSQAG